MPVVPLHHQHEPHECAAAFAAWSGFVSPLGRRPVESTCLTGGTTPIEIREIETP